MYSSYTRLFFQLDHNMVAFADQCWCFINDLHNKKIIVSFYVNAGQVTIILKSTTFFLAAQYQREGHASYQSGRSNSV